MTHPLQKKKTIEIPSKTPKAPKAPASPVTPKDFKMTQDIGESMSNIEKVYKTRQMQLLNKYDDYFHKENSLKSDLEELEHKRKRITESLENCQCYG